jgi:hypothetical protein
MLAYGGVCMIGTHEPTACAFSVMHLLDSSVRDSTPGAVWPSLLVTVYVMGGTGPIKPAAGLKLAVPSDATVTVPATLPVRGSETVTGAEPAG